MSSNFEISQLLEKALTINDIDTFLEWERTEYYWVSPTGIKNVDETPSDHWPIPFKKEDMTHIILEGGLVYGLFYKNQMVAFFIVEFKDEGKSAYVGDLVIHHEYRDKGLAKHILQRIDEIAKEHKCDQCTLTVDPFNGRGVYSYLRHGYKITEFRANEYGPNSDRFFMLKPLLSLPEDEKEEQHVKVLVNDSTQMEKLLKDGFVGIELIRGKDNKSNIIIFKK